MSVKFGYAGESDKGPYPIPANVPIEGGRQSNGDRHALIVDRDNCRLYELYRLFPPANGHGSSNGNGQLKIATATTAASHPELRVLPNVLPHDSEPSPEPLAETL